MDNNWNLQRLKELFALAYEAEKNGKSLSAVFTEMALATGSSAGSVRNYYYSQARLIKIVPEMAQKLGIEHVASRAKPFTTFSKKEGCALVEAALSGKAHGKSVRAVFAAMSDGNSSLALRYQNKYRSILLRHRDWVEGVMAEFDGRGEAYFDPYSGICVNTVVPDLVTSEKIG